jgi:hypothetical protein
VLVESPLHKVDDPEFQAVAKEVKAAFAKLPTFGYVRLTLTPTTGTESTGSGRSGPLRGCLVNVHCLLWWVVQFHLVVRLPRPHVAGLGR